MGHIDHPIRLPDSLTDGEIVLDSHTMPDAEAHLRGEDEEMLFRFDSSQRSTLEQTRAAIRRWIDARTAGGPMFAYALRQPSRLLMGGCEIRLLSLDRANVSYWIFPEFRKQGYATRALALVCQNVARIQDVQQIEAHIDADNIASRRVAEKAGFIETGIVEDESWQERSPHAFFMCGPSSGPLVIRNQPPRTAFSVAFESAAGTAAKSAMLKAEIQPEALPDTRV